MLHNPIIGITGGKRHGKDTTANYIGECLDITRISFAEPLKRCARALFEGYDIKWENKDEEILPIPGNYTVRDLLIALGRGLRDYLDIDFFVKLAQNRIARAKGLVVITDVRYPNEAKLIRSMGGEIIKIVRPELLPYSDAEKQIDLISSDYFLSNVGTLEDLRRKIQLTLVPALLEKLTAIAK